MKHRIVIVDDGKRWYVRRLAFSVEDHLEGFMVYKCDAHLGGPFETLDEATAFAKMVDTTPAERLFGQQPDLLRDAEERWAKKTE